MAAQFWQPRAGAKHHLWWGELADRKNEFQLVGDFLREAAVLVFVLLPFEMKVPPQYRIKLYVSTTIAGVLCLLAGIILEGLG